jgi:hypothetical protein
MQSGRQATLGRESKRRATLLTDKKRAPSQWPLPLDISVAEPQYVPRKVCLTCEHK